MKRMMMMIMINKRKKKEVNKMNKMNRRKKMHQIVNYRVTMKKIWIKKIMKKIKKKE